MTDPPTFSQVRTIILAAKEELLATREESLQLTPDVGSRSVIGTRTARGTPCGGSNRGRYGQVEAEKETQQEFLCHG